MNNAWLNGLLLLILLAWGSPKAHAQTCTATFSNVNFGAISVVSPNANDVNASAVVNCSGFATAYAYVCLSIAQEALPGPTSTKLVNTMYVDSARTQVWGSVWGGPTQTWLTATIPLSGGKGSATIPYYPRVPGNQANAPAGSYSYTYSGGWTGVQGFGFNSGTPAPCTSSTQQYGVFTLTVSAVVTTDCLISVTNIDFGQVGLINNPVNSTGTINTTCTVNAPYSISLSAGQGAGATVSARKMTRSGGGDVLAYALYTSAARTSLWGDGTNGTSTLSSTGTGATQSNTIYASVLAPASVPPGTYVDTVIATITY